MNSQSHQPIDTILQGDSVAILPSLSSASVDFILTDPPYIANYTDRSSRSVRNDDNSDWLKPAYFEMFRVLKPNAFAVSFYGWPKADLFIAAWKSAGFRIAGHLVFRKPYTSRRAFLQYRHEQAYLLVKGRPAYPAAPLPDVMDMPYSGNKLHPTQKPVAILKPLVASFSRLGDVVFDPFAGSGSTLVAAQETGRHYLGIELDTEHHRTASLRLGGTVGRAA